jgi:hypothetical protein
MLPYLEQNSIKNLTTQALLQSSIVPLYNCPSRRPAVKSGGSATGAQLTDYATAQPATEPCGSFPYDPLGAWPFATTGSNASFAIRSYWCGSGASGSWGTDATTSAHYGGVIVRTPYRIDSCSPGVVCLPATATAPAKGEIVPGFPTAVKPGQITDGLSNTLVICEKVVRSDLYDGQTPPPPDEGGGQVSDDKGWADGWDPDSVRFTGVPPISDNDQGVCFNATPSIRRTCIGQGGTIPVLFFGSAHPGGVNAVYADASVHFINFEVDHIVFNALGTRAGEETVALP